MLLLYRHSHDYPVYQRAGLRLPAGSVVAHLEDGTQMLNFTEWLGTTSAVVLSNTYRPDNKRGVEPTAARVGYSVGGDIGFDVLREFWPEIAGKFRLPFRGQNEPGSPRPASEKQGS